MRAIANLSVKGIRYYKAAELLQKGSLSAGLAIRLEHEPDNPHDENAVAVRVKRTGAMLGHISRELATKYVALLNSGKFIEAEITDITKENRYINIYIRIVYEQSDNQLAEKHSSGLPNLLCQRNPAFSQCGILIPAGNISVRRTDIEDDSEAGVPDAIPRRNTADWLAYLVAR
jgi:hypothetical protein